MKTRERLAALFIFLSPLVLLVGCPKETEPLPGIAVGNHDLDEARRRIGLAADAFVADGTRITANLDFSHRQDSHRLGTD